MSFKTELCNSKDCLDINFKVLSTLGIWMPKNYDGTMKEIFYRLFSFIFLGSLFFIYVISEVVLLFTVIGHLELVVKTILLTLTHLTQLYKTLNIILRRAGIQKLLDTLDEPIMNEVDADFIPDIQAKKATLRKATQLIIFLSTIAVITWVLFPFLQAEKVQLPILGWTPFSVDCSPIFELMFVYQFCATMINAWNDCAMDTLFSGSIGLACIQLDNLKEKLRDKKRIYVPLSDSDPGITREDHLKRHKEMKKHFENCIEHHLSIIRFIEETQKLFGFSALIQFGGTTILICMVAFKITSVPISLELFSMLMYLSAVLLEVSLYCYYGNQLIVKSEEVARAVYESLWYKQSLENRKLIFILMERTKRPLKITAIIFDLSLSTLMSIFKSSYSYYAVLQRVNRK